MQAHVFLLAVACLAYNPNAISTQNDLSALELGLLANTWPMRLIEDPAMQAKYVDTPAEFLREVLVGDHLKDFIVLRNGTDTMRLSWKETVPKDLQNLLAGCKSSVDVLRELLGNAAILDRFDFRMDLYGEDLIINRTMIWSSDGDGSGGGGKPRQIFLSKAKDILEHYEKNAIVAADVYFAEVSFRQQVQHPMSETKTFAVFNQDVEHLLGPYATWNWHWDSQHAGLFIGGRFSGTGMHVDQALWSDLGRNLQGYKLVAVWPAGKHGASAMKALSNDLFRPPLNKQQIAILQTASKVVLLRPGDMYIFSGGVAHAALCVSVDELCLGSYESSVSLHPRHVELWKHKGIPNRICDMLHCIGDEGSESARYSSLNASISKLEAAAVQTETGGPAAQPHASRPETMPIEWTQIIQTLNSDTMLYAKLRKLYTQAVEVLMRNKHFRTHVPKSVLRVAGLKNQSDPSLEDDYALSTQCETEHLGQTKLLQMTWNLYNAETVRHRCAHLTLD